MIDPDEGVEDGGQEDEAVSEGEDLGQVSGSGEEENEKGPDDEGEEGQVDEPPRQPSRAEKRFQTLTAATKEAKERAERLDREVQELRAEQRQRAQQTAQESPEARASRRALMDPMDVMREDLAESEKRTQGILHQQALITQETNDKLTYNAILRDAPHLKKYDAEVERLRQDQQKMGIFVQREVLLDLAIGRAARAAAVKGAPRAQAAAAARVAAQQARPAGSKGDTATSRGKQQDSPEKRLENVPI